MECNNSVHTAAKTLPTCSTFCTLGSPKATVLLLLTLMLLTLLLLLLTLFFVLHARRGQKFGKKNRAHATAKRERERETIQWPLAGWQRSWHFLRRKKEQQRHRERKQQVTNECYLYKEMLRIRPQKQVRRNVEALFLFCSTPHIV